MKKTIKQMLMMKVDDIRNNIKDYTNVLLTLLPVTDQIKTT